MNSCGGQKGKSLETQGLVKISYHGLDKEHSLPTHWENKGLTQQDWVDFLKVALDFTHVNSFIQIDEGWKDWIEAAFLQKPALTRLKRER